MATTDFGELFATLKLGVATIARETVADYARQATREGHKALTGLKTDLKKWAEAAARGELSEEDLAHLLKGRQELTEMEGLKQLGIGTIQLDKFKNSVVNLVLDKIVRLRP